MEYWRVEGNELVLDRLVSIDEVVTEYSYVIRSKARMEYSLNSDPYINEEERKEALDFASKLN